MEEDFQIRNAFFRLETQFLDQKQDVYFEKKIFKVEIRFLD